MASVLTIATLPMQSVVTRTCWKEALQLFFLPSLWLQGRLGDILGEEAITRGGKQSGKMILTIVRLSRMFILTIKEEGNFLLVLHFLKIYFVQAVRCDGPGNI